jgi:hypothetical protein
VTMCSWLFQGRFTGILLTELRGDVNSTLYCVRSPPCLMSGKIARLTPSQSLTRFFAHLPPDTLRDICRPYWSNAGCQIGGVEASGGTTTMWWYSRGPKT